MSVLDDLVAGALADARGRERALPLAELERLLDRAPAPLDPLPALAAPGISIIAEIKRASPSKGHLAELSDPAQQASAYAEGGAAAISVLTEERVFKGSLADLDLVRATVGVPILRKDFIGTEYQLVEARVHGADLALLIVAALDDARLHELYTVALELGLTPLIEVHTVEEAERAGALGARLVGVNNRDLKTLQVDLGNFARLTQALPADAVKVAESGITGPDDVRLVREAGADAVLVGEALVKAASPTKAIAAMLAAGGATDE